VFVWVCAWGYLALEQWQRRSPSVLTGVVFTVLIFGLAIILANFYYPQYRSSLGTMSGRLDEQNAGQTDDQRGELEDAFCNGAARGERYGV